METSPQVVGVSALEEGGKRRAVGVPAVAEAGDVGGNGRQLTVCDTEGFRTDVIEARLGVDLEARRRHVARVEDEAHVVGYDVRIVPAEDGKEVSELEVVHRSRYQHLPADAETQPVPRVLEIVHVVKDDVLSVGVLIAIVPWTAREHLRHSRSDLGIRGGILYGRNQVSHAKAPERQ